MHLLQIWYNVTSNNICEFYIHVAGIPSWYLTKPPRHTQPGHPSMSRLNDWQWSQPPLEKNRRTLIRTAGIQGLTGPVG